MLCNNETFSFIDLATFYFDNTIGRMSNKLFEVNISFFLFLKYKPLHVQSLSEHFSSTEQSVLLWHSHLS